MLGSTRRLWGNAMERREFIGTLAGGVVAASLPTRLLTAEKVPRLGFLGGNSGLPAGVTLQPPDGGQTYYASNGFTYAANLNWDTTVFPIANYRSVYSNVAYGNAIATWTDLGWNFAWEADAFDVNQAIANGVGRAPSCGGSAYNGAADSTIVGFVTQDEPTTYAIGVSGPLSGTPNANQDSRFWLMNNTHYWLRGKGAFTGARTQGAPAPATATSILSDLITTPNGIKRHIDINSVDLYWFSASRDPSWSGYLMSGTGAAGPAMYNLGRLMTLDEAQRGSNYGDQIDIIRGYQNGHYPAPIVTVIETGDPFTADPGDGSCYIQSTEINWAVWSSIIHGARAILWFDHNFSGPATSAYAMITSAWMKTVRPGQTLSPYDQVKQTNLLVKNLTPIILSDFALGYVSVVPAGYTFPTKFLNLSTGGIEIMAKYYTKGTYTNSSGIFPNGFYIFATTRYGMAHAMPVTATFTISNSGNGATLATVVGESRTIPIVNGIFSDTFAKASTVHIYEIS